MKCGSSRSQERRSDSAMEPVQVYLSYEDIERQNPVPFRRNRLRPHSSIYGNVPAHWKQAKPV